tara:strand:- start:150 stop:422 length:273 start_codon:yes stop_codon:yes gene_type:complete
MASNVIYELAGIKVIWSPIYAVFEVWRKVQDGSIGWCWECAADTPDQEEAVLIADQIFFKSKQHVDYVPKQVMDEEVLGYGDYYESEIDF